jgi:protein SPT2
MEFVERRYKTKAVVVPNSVDYSDLFPESFIGSETEALAKLRADTAAASEANKRILEDQAKLREEFRRVAELDRKDNGRRASDIQWVAVDSAERRLDGKAGDASSRAGPARPASKKERDEMNRKSLAESTAARAKALLDLINEANGKPNAASAPAPERQKPATASAVAKRASSDNVDRRARERVERAGAANGRKRDRPARSPPRRERDLPSRKRVVDSDTSEDEREYSDDQEDASENDSFIDDGDESGDDEDAYATGFEAVQAEERRSAKIAAREDAREMRRLEEAKQEKKRRRLEWERRQRERR